MPTQREKAEQFRELHHTRLLILPNVWDVLGAKLLEDEGYPAIATASASIALSHGYVDGENIPFEKACAVIRAICNSTALPVTADIEHAYAIDDETLEQHILALIDCGIAGINYEDATGEARNLVDLTAQCESIRRIRTTATKAGIPLFINARTDVFLSKTFAGDKKAEAIRRGLAFKDAGADCFYPVLCDNASLPEIVTSVDLPLNVLAVAGMLPLDTLRHLGVARVSLGPGLLKAAFWKMQEVVRALKNEDIEPFTHAGIPTSADLARLVRS